eukprot:Hpha_TRINITY_DN7374_c0_g1::TRINITY_DN7374_c0_g1_i1::g.10102::m.10102/K10585/UBE2Z; ubiquitin-conjugating enzyme E2 Z
MPPLWDPLAESSSAEPSGQCVKRVHRDLKSFLKDPVQGIRVFADEVRADFAHALIEGPAGTPYEGGVFYFILWFPPRFPLLPPKVRFATTDGGRVRFNPNLYADGKVCLSVLGTFSGPSWVPSLGVRGTLLSIQSLLSAEPWENEPEIHAGTAEQRALYNESLRHETVRVAAIGMADPSDNMRPQMPAEVASAVQEIYSRNRGLLVGLCEERLDRDGTPMLGLFGVHQSDRFRWKQLRRRLTEVVEVAEAEGSGVRKPEEHPSPGALVGMREVLAGLLVTMLLRLIWRLVRARR